MGDILACQTQSLAAAGRLKTACFISLQDKVEAADCGRAGAAGGSWELLRPAEDVPVPVFLPAEPGVQPGPRGGLVPVQGPLGAPAGPTETAGPADPPARAAGGRRAAAASTPPHVRSASPACAAAVSRAPLLSFYRPNWTRFERTGQNKEKTTNSPWDETGRNRAEKTLNGLFVVVFVCLCETEALFIMYLFSRRQ